MENGGKDVRITLKGGSSRVVHVDNPRDNFLTPVISEDRRTVAFSKDVYMDASYQMPAFVFAYRVEKSIGFDAADGKPGGECFKGGVALD